MSNEQDTTKKVSSYDELYVGRFLKAGNLKGSQVTLTIAGLWTEELTGEKGVSRKAIVSFEKTDMQHVLPKINGTCLKAMFGGDVTQWIGKRVALYPTDQIMPMPTARGADRFCIRIFGSPDINEPVHVVYTPPKRRAIHMTMQPTGKRKAVPVEREEPAAVEMTEDGVPVPHGAGVE